MSVIHLPPPKPATINEVAAIEFEPLPADTPIPSGFDDVELASRVAHAIAIRSKDELVAVVLRAGPDGAQEMVEYFDAAEGRLTALAELAAAARARIMVAMGAAAQG